MSDSHYLFNIFWFARTWILFKWYHVASTWFIHYSFEIVIWLNTTEKWSPSIYLFRGSINLNRCVFYSFCVWLKTYHSLMAALRGTGPSNVWYREFNWMNCNIPDGTCLILVHIWIELRDFKQISVSMNWRKKTCNEFSYRILTILTYLKNWAKLKAHRSPPTSQRISRWFSMNNSLSANKFDIQPTDEYSINNITARCIGSRKRNVFFLSRRQQKQPEWNGAMNFNELEIANELK